MLSQFSVIRERERMAQLLPILRNQSLLRAVQRGGLLGVHNRAASQTATAVADNPFYAKYADKLKHLKESSPEEYESKLATFEEMRKKEIQKFQEESQAASSKMKSKMDKGFSTAVYSKPTKPAGNKTLDDIMNVDLIKDKTPEEITHIWKEHHKAKDCIFGVIPADAFKTISSRAKDFSTFIYPLPKGEGYEFYLQQFNNHDCYFTPLIQYQTHGENAPACLTMQHYTELADDKNIVLMAGEVDTQIMKIPEAQLLATQLSMFYGENAGQRFDLVKLMHEHPDQFSHEQVITAYESVHQDNMVTS